MSRAQEEQQAQDLFDWVYAKRGRPGGYVRGLIARNANYVWIAFIAIPDARSARSAVLVATVPHMMRRYRAATGYGGAAGNSIPAFFVWQAVIQI
jgi:hypothetical protein